MPSSPCTNGINRICWYINRFSFPGISRHNSKHRCSKSFFGLWVRDGQSPYHYKNCSGEGVKRIHLANFPALARFALTHLSKFISSFQLHSLLQSLSEFVYEMENRRNPAFYQAYSPSVLQKTRAFCACEKFVIYAGIRRWRLFSEIDTNDSQLVITSSYTFSRSLLNKLVVPSGYTPWYSLCTLAYRLLHPLLVRRSSLFTFVLLHSLFTLRLLGSPMDQSDVSKNERTRQQPINLQHSVSHEHRQHL